ncbi:MAG: molybdenum cofactor guanylyltransferase MobA [Gammaproteobacteria bacterium]
MKEQTKATGVVLAGGLARRMGNQDKGLVLFRGKPMIEYALAALAPAVDKIMINANRNLERYRAYGYPVVADTTDSFDGPLAGVLSAMKHCDTPLLLVMPCDSPLAGAEHLKKLLTALRSSEADACVAFDGERLHPVFLALKTSLEASLESFLAGGERKIDVWLARQRTVRADFSREPEIFSNINTLEELSELEAAERG